jgi:hypothetical protein
MKVELIIAIVVGAYVLRTVLRNAKKQRENLQRGAQISNNPPQAVQNFETSPPPQAPMSGMEGRSLEQRLADILREEVPPQRPAQPENPFSLEEQRGHYDEEALAAEYEQTHAEGRTVSHHKHKLFDEQKDRAKAQRHKAQAPKPVKLHGAKQAGRLDVMAAGFRQERRVKRQHPIAAQLRQQGGMRQAIILAEILRRPEY